MQVITSWTGSQADALRRALHKTNESFADHLGVSVRTVAYWRTRPDMVPQQKVQDDLETALDHATDQEKAQFALLVNGTVPPEALPQQSIQNEFTDDGARLPADSGQAVTLLDVLAGADMANRLEVAQAGWLTGTAPSVITGYLFSSPTWQHEEVPLAVAANTAAGRIRAVAKHLMDIDFQFGSGYVRRMLLFYFQSEIVPLLREPHPEPVRREIFGAAAEVAQLIGWSAYDAGRHGAGQSYFMQGLQLHYSSAFTERS